MTNAERVVLVSRARDLISRVRAGLDPEASTCPRCAHRYSLDPAAHELGRALNDIDATLSSWITTLRQRRPASAHVSSEA